ncbi:hypothetical protein FJT64_003772 [Amphibalanus amphitrite]|uniref:Carbohydrate sulfotransferase n=1 Tax=Amphibalanus amphitrite TaxID=1232801 RepID=A0A6A4W7H7_AMPAM|nr:hypothetical protein FJT64_003772 [Amphibalanus amphitrite]
MLEASNVLIWRRRRRHSHLLGFLFLSHPMEARGAMACRRPRRRLGRLLSAGLAACLLLTLLISLDLLPAPLVSRRPRPAARRTGPTPDTFTWSQVLPDTYTWSQAEVDDTMLSRVDHLATVCKKHKLGLWQEPGVYPDIAPYPPSPQYGVWYFNRKYKLGYCPLYKSGSTSWLYNFALLGGYTEEQIARSARQISDISRSVTPELEFDGARQRLISAYRDKLENIRVGLQHGTEHFYKKYGRRIVEKYRRKGAGVLGRGWDALNVMREVINRVAFQPGHGDDERVPPLGIEPTFGEFVQYLIDTDLANYADDHWIPYYLFSPGLTQSRLRDEYQSAGIRHALGSGIVGGHIGPRAPIRPQ